MKCLILAAGYASRPQFMPWRCQARDMTSAIFRATSRYRKNIQEL